MNTFSHLIRIDLHCCLNFFKDEYFSSILEVSMMQKRNWHICLLLPVLYDAPHATCQSVLWVDFNDGQFLIAMRCRCFLYNSDAMSRVFGHSYHRNRCDYFCSTIGTDCFPMFFPISEPEKFTINEHKLWINNECLQNLWLDCFSYALGSNKGRQITTIVKELWFSMS